MNIIVKIQEREAIPIRALPFVAGFEQFSLDPILSPYMIAMSAGMPNEPSIGNGLPTYSFANNEIRQLAPSEWGAIIEQMEKPLNNAVAELPSGVFVFADEFANWFEWFRQAENQVFETATFRININPLLPDALQDVVMEGFVADAVTNPDETIRPRKKNVLVNELRDIWPNIENDLNNAGRNGLHSAKLSDHGMWDMAGALNWAIKKRGTINIDKVRRQITTDHPSELSILFATLIK
jgi:hypothetical protein